MHHNLNNHIINPVSGASTARPRCQSPRPPPAGRAPPRARDSSVFNQPGDHTVPVTAGPAALENNCSNAEADGARLRGLEVLAGRYGAVQPQNSRAAQGGHQPRLHEPPALQCEEPSACASSRRARSARATRVYICAGSLTVLHAPSAFGSLSNPAICAMRARWPQGRHASGCRRRSSFDRSWTNASSTAPAPRSSCCELPANSCSCCSLHRRSWGRASAASTSVLLRHDAWCKLTL